MSKIVKATLTRCRDQKPLVVLNSEPFNGMEIRPCDLLALAQHLTEIAELSAAHKTDGKLFAPLNVVLGGDDGLLADYSPKHKGV